MRRISAILACSILVQVCVATPALAWWDWLEEWSGPGPWKGPVFGARLVCFVADKNAPTQGVRPKVVPVGLLYSACELDDTEWRRASIELGMRFLWTRDDRFAGGRRISLTTLEPSFSWSIINNPDWNFVDYGMGGGFYWVSSEAFPSVNGGFLEPLRLDFHAPANSNPWARIPILRVGVLVFPGGFEPGAFAPGPGAARRISRDWAKYIGIYTDLDALVEAVRGR